MIEADDVEIKQLTCARRRSVIAYCQQDLMQKVDSKMIESWVEMLNRQTYPPSNPYHLYTPPTKEPEGGKAKMPAVAWVTIKQPLAIASKVPIRTSCLCLDVKGNAPRAVPSTHQSNRSGAVSLSGVRRPWKET